MFFYTYHKPQELRHWAAPRLPVLALDLQPEDKVLDLCASPGAQSR